MLFFSELQSVIRRVRPHLLLHQHHPSTAAAGSLSSVVESTNNNNNEVVARNELQLEAASELINAVATFVWKLDCLWDDHSMRQQEQQYDDNGAVGNEATNNNNDTRSTSASPTASQHEPYTEWNEDAKALIREGYGMISAVSQPWSSSLLDDTNAHPNNNDEDQRQQKETMRTLARSSILELLTSVSTSSCRHFLLAFLPHFTPITLEEEKQSSSEKTNGKTQLQQSNVLCQPVGKEKSSDPEVISQLLEAFQSLIQTDATTLVPFLSTLSNLFGSASWDKENYHHVKTEMANDDDDDDNDGAEYHYTNNPRQECFQICISSMSSIPENDLPSLLKSLFTLVRSEEEGRLAMESVRNECNSAFGSTTSTIPDPSILCLVPKDDGDLSLNDCNISNDNNYLVLFIANVIIQSLLSDEVHGSKYLVKGFLDEIRHSLYTQTQLQNETTPTSTTSHAGKSLSCLTTLDAIVLIALHSHDEYQSSVESIIESLTTYQAMLFFGLIQPLIESWKPAKYDRTGTHQTCSLLYSQLSSSLISLLFYMLMVSTMTVPSQGGDSQFTLVNGLLSFHYAEETATSAIDTRECNMTYAVTCCRVISNLYSNIDPQKQQQVVNSLLSMVTDSFVRSSSTFTIDVHHRNIRKKTSLNEGDTKGEKGCVGSLLAASYAACRTILLISTTHATNLSQMKGTVMDRLLLLASMSASISSQQEGGKTDDVTISYHLFDMNCAIIISLLQDNEQLRYNDFDRETEAPINGNSASELLILCQKFLFATDYLSSEGTNNNPEHRVICGIILASRLLRCKFILRSERGNIWNWMMSVITPAPTVTAPIQALNPVVAQWGLSFLSFASSPVAHNSFHPEITEFVETNSVCGHSDVFNQVNKMLATAAVIQMEDSLRIPLRHESSNENTTFLAYSHASQKKASVANSMVISSPYFLYGKQSGEPKPSPSSINQVADYVYDLLDRYLELGRIRSSGALGSKSSWNPRGWLLTKIQLPCCLPQSTMILLGMKNNSLELGDEATNANDDVNPENWKQLFPPEVSKAALLRSLMEFVSCVVVSISVSCAVLKHAHDHFLHEQVQLAEMGDSDSDDAKKMKKKKQKQVEALRKLLQFQVNKVVSMQRVCLNIYQSLNGMHLAACKQRLSGSTEKTSLAQNNDIFHDKRRIPLAEIKSLLTSVESFLNSRMNRFDSSILWSCMLDDVDDAFLLETMTKSASMDEQSLSRQQQIIHFRIRILRYLQHSLTSNNKMKRLHGSALGYNTSANLSLHGISRVFQLLMSLTPCLSSNFSESTSEYVSALYKILLAALSLAASSEEIGPTMIDNALVDVIPNRRRSKAIKPDPHGNRNLQLDNLMRRFAATKDAVDNNSILTETDVTASVVKLKERLLQQLEKCEDASMSCFILDLISILVIHKESSRGAMADITWKSIHSVYHISSSNVTHLPYMLFEINRIISEVTKNEHCDAERVAVVKDTFSNLLRLSSALLETKFSHTKTFYHNLLAHYSSLLIERVSQSQCLAEICTALEATIAFAREKRSTPKSLPGLNEKNLPSVFEMLLHMNALSFSLAKPISSKKHRPLNAEKTQGPYCEIIWPIKMFGKLLLLYKANHQSFAQRVFFNVVKHSLLMIKICEYQLRYCVDWRNSQNVSLVATGSHDYAAAEMLQPLIDCIASACIGDITLFCRTIKNELSDSSYKNTKPLAGLIYRIQGIKETLQSICQNQSLKFPQKFSPSDAASNKRDIVHDSAPEKKRRRTHSLQTSNNSRLLSSSVLEQLPTTAPERSSSESEDSGMSFDDSSSDSDDDSFGAVGDWAT